MTGFKVDPPPRLQAETDHMHEVASVLLARGDYVNAADVWRQEYERLLHAQATGTRVHKGRPAHNVGFARIRAGAFDIGLRWTLMAFLEDALSNAEAAGPRGELTMPASETLRLYDIPEGVIHGLARQVRDRYLAGARDSDPMSLWEPLHLDDIMARFSPADGSASDRSVKVFVSSPSDMRPLRLRAIDVCDVLTRMDGRLVQPLLWEGGAPERPSVPGVPPRITGAGAQAVIDDHIWGELGGYDIHLGIQGDKIGTKTHGFRSGTEAELRYAYERWSRDGAPRLLLYRVTGGSPDPEVAEFISEMHDLGIVAKTFEPDDFWMSLLVHLRLEIARVVP